MWHRDHGLLNYQEDIMEIVIVTFGIGTLVLLATHMIEYAVETALRSSSYPFTPEEESRDPPLPFEGAVGYEQAA